MQSLFNHLSQCHLTDTIVSCFIINLSFFISCFWIYRNDVGGKWEKYRIRLPGIKQQPIDYEARKKTYKGQVKSVSIDLGLVMPFFFFLASSRMFREWRNPLFDIALTFLAYLVFRLWSFTVHVIMHKTPSLVKHHKQHHLPMNEMTCVSTFTDSMTEFLLMELFAEIAGICAVGGLPMPCIVLLGVYNVVNGGFDHSGFCLDDFWFNSMYHYTHHAEPTWNYAQLSYIDRLCGTYKQYPLQETVDHFRPAVTPTE